MPETSTRKRKRQAEDDEFDPSRQIYDENGKTRRINPFSMCDYLGHFYPSILTLSLQSLLLVYTQTS